MAAASSSDSIIGRTVPDVPMAEGNPGAQVRAGCHGPDASPNPRNTQPPLPPPFKVNLARIPTRVLATILFPSDSPPQVRISELGKKVAVFFIPGAFTPTCSAQHLPGFAAHFDRIKAAGVDAVVCASVNDA